LGESERVSIITMDNLQSRRLPDDDSADTPVDFWQRHHNLPFPIEFDDVVLPDPESERFSLACSPPEYLLFDLCISRPETSSHYNVKQFSGHLLY
jgi:hypothetical protein